jgi:hypothetical protein
MKEQPSLQTNRLVLRPSSLADATIEKELAGDREMASTTLNISHPYEDGTVEDWIKTHQQKYDKGELVNFAIVPVA